MKRYALIFGCLLAAHTGLQTLGAATCGGHGDRNTMLVSTDWLSQHMKDKNLVILALGREAEFKEHIPGAIALNPNKLTTTMETGKLMLELPPIDQAQQYLASLGITNLTGHPAACLKAGFVDGLPQALMITGRLYDEASVLRVALAYERATKWRAMNPPLDENLRRMKTAAAGQAGPMGQVGPVGNEGDEAFDW